MCRRSRRAAPTALVARRHEIRCDGMRLQWMILVLLVGAAADAAAADAADGERARPKNVLLFTLDTTRADHLGCYGHAPAKTAAIDNLSRRGVLFEQARTPAPLTLP